MNRVAFVVLCLMASRIAQADLRDVRNDDDLAVAIKQAKPGDWISLREGIYERPLLVAKNFTKAAPLVITAAGSGKVTFKVKGLAADIRGKHIVIRNIVFDSQYAACSAVHAKGEHLTFDNCEILRAGSIDGERGGDGMQLFDSSNCLIEYCLVHHCLATNKAGERVDSHGIRLTNSDDITIRHCNIDLVSGDCIQVDPNREAWDKILIEDCSLTGGKVAANDPLTHPRFATGSCPAENAIDTKCPKKGQPQITVRHCLVSGFRGPIGNAAAFNIKENCDATIDRCTISDSVIGLRLRGPAKVTVTNCVLFDNDTHCRYEDKIPQLHILHCTFGTVTGDGRGVFQEQKPSPDLRVLGCLFLDAKPKQADNPSNQAITAVGFMNTKTGDYRLAKPLPLANGSFVAANESLQTDRAGKPRSAKTLIDAGAYQFQP